MADIDAPLSWRMQQDGYLMEIAELRKENAKLRERIHELEMERDSLLMNSSPTANEMRRVRAAWKKDRAENAKLRELVHGMRWCQQVENRGACDDCPIGGSGISRCDRMTRELGIEVTP